MKVYGIKSCASVKKALPFFEQNNIAYEFIDVSKNGLSIDKVNYWKGFEPLKVFINSRSKPYRDLKLKEKKYSENKLTDLLVQNPGLLKRPVIEHGLNGEEKLTVGFNEDLYKQLFLNM